MSITYASQRNVASKENPPSLPVTTYNTWTRPSDWLTLPTVGPTDQKFAGLYAVFNNDSNYVALSATTSTGTYTVDWGDGSSPSTYTSGTVAQYAYNYATVSSGTLTTRGYKQCIITVTATTGNLTGVSMNQKYVNTPALPKYNAKWLDVIVGSPNLTSITVTPNGAVVSAHMLEQFTLVSKSSSLTTFVDLFYICNGLRKVNIDANMSDVVSTSAMFYTCISLEEAPYFDTSNVTNTSYMFSTCNSLKYVPKYNTSNVTNTLNMFDNCFQITEIPPLDFSNVTVMTGTFGNCRSLESIPYLNTIKVTSMFNTFIGCRSLITIPTFNTTNVSNLTSTFANCTSLESIPLFDTSNVTSSQTTFQNCAALKEVPLLNLSKTTDTISMFASCASLETIPAFNLSNVTNTATMFSGAISLTSVPDLNLSKVTATNGMFQSCNALPTIGNLVTTNLATTTNMFNGCTSLESVPLFDTSNVITATTMFSGCTNLKSEGLPTFNFAKATSVNGLFQTCTSLVTVPQYDFANATSIGAMFSGASSLASIPAYNFANVGAAAASFAAQTSSMGNCAATGMRFAIDFSNSLMGKTNLEQLFVNLGTASTAQTLTITGNPGADTAISKTGTWTTSSKNVTITVSGSVTTGMYAYGTAVSAITCSFTDSTDIVTVTGGPATAPIAGTLVAFPSIVSTTGISINRLYYVVNPSGATFQVALTPGGAPIALTTNGTGSMRYALQVTNVVGTTVTLDNFPMAPGSGTPITFRILNTNLATFKFWTVSG